MESKPTNPCNSVKATGLCARGKPPAPRDGQRTRNDKKLQAGGRVYCLETKEGEEEEEGGDPHTVVSGTFTVNTLLTTMLFDAGATHSFINLAIAKQLACAFEELDAQLCVSSPIGSSYQADLIVRNCSITIQNRIFFADLVLLGIQGYDVILGMDWLTTYQATIDCKRKTLTIVTFEGETLTYKGSDNIPTVSLISGTRAYNLVKKGCPAFLCVVELIEASDLQPKDIPVVQDFPEVFQEVPGLPAEGEIEFAIKLVPRTAPISTAPYRMAPAELTS